MPRTFSLLLGAVTIAAASGLYALKFNTARLEDQVHGLERAIEKTEGDIAVLKAERAYLGRPDRIDTLARKQGLGPIRPDQYQWSASPGMLAVDGAAKPNVPVDGLKGLTDAEALAAARAILAPSGDDGGSKR
jgi:hypothetical protein